jgi:predicted dehydrogenase
VGRQVGKAFPSFLPVRQSIATKWRTECAEGGKPEMLNIAVVGVGYWGPNLVRNFASLEDAKIISVCDVDRGRLQPIKRLYPTVNLTSSFDDILGDPEIEAVVVALPVSHHYRFTKAALEAGKHVLVEKPLCTNSTEAKELIDIAGEKHLTLMVGHTFEYNAAVAKLKDLIQGGTLGQIYYVYSQRLNLGKVRSDINTMWNLAPHDISIILYCLDCEPVRVSARGLTQLQDNIEDVVFMNLEFEGGVLAHIHNSWLDPNKIRKMTVVGSSKMVVYDDVSADAKIQVYDKGIDKKNISQDMGSYDDFGKFQLIQRAGDLLIPKINFVEPLRLECQHFIECAREGKRPLTDGENGLRVVKVLEAAQKSLTKGGAVIDLEMN